MPDINKSYTWAIQTCNSNNIGYSQTYRNQQTVNVITYYDCSSFINYALVAGGFDTPSYAPNHNAFTTYTMPAELARLGFVEVDATGARILPLHYPNRQTMITHQRSNVLPDMKRSRNIPVKDRACRIFPCLLYTSRCV